MPLNEKTKLSLWLFPGYLAGFVGMAALAVALNPGTKHMENLFLAGFVAGPPLVCLPLAYLVGRHQFRRDLPRQRFLLWIPGLMLINLVLGFLALTLGPLAVLTPVVSVGILLHVCRGLVLTDEDAGS